jgi:hypothetical protein
MGRLLLTKTVIFQIAYIEDRRDAESGNWSISIIFSTNAFLSFGSKLLSRPAIQE